jgi:hypothetical protein
MDLCDLCNRKHSSLQEQVRSSKTLFQTQHSDTGYAYVCVYHEDRLRNVQGTVDHIQDRRRSSPRPRPRPLLASSPLNISQCNSAATTWLHRPRACRKHTLTPYTILDTYSWLFAPCCRQLAASALALQEFLQTQDRQTGCQESIRHGEACKGETRLKRVGADSGPSRPTGVSKHLSMVR